jgi:hypothetical protein
MLDIIMTLLYPCENDKLKFSQHDMRIIYQKVSKWVKCTLEKTLLYSLSRREQIILKHWGFLFIFMQEYPTFIKHMLNYIKGKNKLPIQDSEDVWRAQRGYTSFYTHCETR